MVIRDKLGRFTKECVGKENIFYGRHHKEETKIEHGEVIKEKWKNPKYRENQIKKRKGQHTSPTTEFKKGIIPWNKNLKGIHLNPETEFKEGQHKGKDNPSWKGGITPLNRLLRASSKYKIWRELVFLRDNFTCQNPNCKFCYNKIGGRLHAHHIKSFAEYYELRFDINNGITLCKNFHRSLRGKEKQFETICLNKIKNSL